MSFQEKENTKNPLLDSQVRETLGQALLDQDAAEGYFADKPEGYLLWKMQQAADGVMGNFLFQESGLLSALMEKNLHPNWQTEERPVIANLDAQAGYDVLLTHNLGHQGTQLLRAEIAAKIGMQNQWEAMQRDRKLSKNNHSLDAVRSRFTGMLMAAGATDDQIESLNKIIGRAANETIKDFVQKAQQHQKS